jgi:rod shape determining protein RodA
MKRSILSFDIYVLAASLALMFIGVLFIYSSGVTASGEVFSNEYLRQIIWVGSGLAILIVVSLIDYSKLSGPATYIYGLCVALLVVTLLFGRVVNGARSWLGIGSLGIQPSEFAKIGVILLLAKHFEQIGRRIRELRHFLISLAIPAVPMILVLLQPDLGTASVFAPIFLFMAFAAGAKPRHIIFLVAGAAILVSVAVFPAYQDLILGRRLPVLRILTETRLVLILSAGVGMAMLLAGGGYFFLHRRYFYWLAYGCGVLLFGLVGSLAARAVLEDYQMMRLIVFLDPYVDPRGAGWNIIQSVTAVGSGGLGGKGWLRGTQSHYQFLPQQSTDFIFSILAEEWGFIGAIGVFALFGVILFRGLVIVNKARDSFASLLGTGVVGMIFFHFAVNIGMAIGVMPITGIPLFFLSHGGSSLWTALIGVGLLMSVYQNRYKYA